MPDSLVQRCRNGDRQAQRELYNRYIDRVFGLCLRMLGERSGAKDAAQEAFIRIFSRLGQYRKEAELSTWVYRITANVCYDTLRTRRSNVVSMDANPVLEGDRNVRTEAGQQRSAVEEVVRKILDTVNDEWAKTFWLFTMEQLSQKEIAEIQKISLPTVKMRLAKVRDIIRSQLNREDI